LSSHSAQTRRSPPTPPIARAGGPLARLQGRVVLEETLLAMPGYRLAGEPERIATHNTRGVARLPILVA
jgi:cytochrome P450